jgi:hypothetical protein
MENQSSFKTPGRDGQLPANANIWRKGLVYTRRSAPDEEYLAKPGYRVSAAFKCGTGGSSADAGFQALYQRVRAVANQAIAEKTCSNAGETAGSIVLCHGWRRFGYPEISTAFLMLEFRCSHLDDSEMKGETDPTEHDFLSSGGTSFEELARINPQRADEFYNEFDFSDASTWESEPVPSATESAFRPLPQLISNPSYTELSSGRSAIMRF